jgi:hypothetical protein
MQEKPKTNRGEMARRENAKNQSKKCYADLLNKTVQVTYYDHVYFKGINSSDIKPIVRKTVGWLFVDTTDYIRLISDRSNEHMIGEKWETGLILLKSCIIEVVVLSPASDLNKEVYQIMGNLCPIIEENKKCKS